MSPWRCASSAAPSGTYSNIDPAVERHVAAALGLTPVPATQVIARDRHAEYLYACASIGSTMELIAVELRHLQRTEVSEVQEGFKAGQKGSSAMPHKRNPISAETISGLSRVLRGNLQAGMQDVALWHERDISHSSVERVVLPDSSLLAYYVLRRMDRLVGGLQVFPDRMVENLDASHGLVFSQPVLLGLVQAGMSRDAAYRVVQENAARAWAERTLVPRPAGVRRAGHRPGRRARRRLRPAAQRPPRRRRRRRPRRPLTRDRASSPRSVAEAAPHAISGVAPVRAPWIAPRRAARSSAPTIELSPGRPRGWRRGSRASGLRGGRGSGVAPPAPYIEPLRGIGWAGDLAYSTAVARSAANASATPGWVFGRVTQKCSAGGSCRPFIRQPLAASESLTW